MSLDIDGDGRADFCLIKSDGTIAYEIAYWPIRARHADEESLVARVMAAKATILNGKVSVPRTGFVVPFSVKVRETNLASSSVCKDLTFHVVSP